MRVVYIYLTAYFILIIGALVALWYGNALQSLPPLWIVTGLVIAIGLGVLLAVASRKPEITRE